MYVSLVLNYLKCLKTIFTQYYYPTKFLRQWFARGSNTCYPWYFTIYFFPAKQLNFFDCFVAKYLSIYQINKPVKLYPVLSATSSQFSYLPRGSNTCWPHCIIHNKQSPIFVIILSIGCSGWLFSLYPEFQYVRTTH